MLCFILIGFVVIFVIPYDDAIQAQVLHKGEILISRLLRQVEKRLCRTKNLALCFFQRSLNVLCKDFKLRTSSVSIIRSDALFVLDKSNLNQSQILSFRSLSTLPVALISLFFLQGSAPLVCYRLLYLFYLLSQTEYFKLLPL